MIEFGVALPVGHLLECLREAVATKGALHREREEGERVMMSTGTVKEQIDALVGETLFVQYAAYWI